MTTALHRPDRTHDRSPAHQSAPGRSASSTPTEIPAVIGADLQVPLVTGARLNYANLDHAASAPCLAEVHRRIDEFLPWYASVHRGAGLASQASTRIYERTRDVLRTFVDARSRDAVIITRNTTDALNLLARAVPRHTTVVQFDTDHHAALLPWRGPHHRRIPTPRTRHAAVAALDATLADCPEGPRLVVLAGASNVTGEILPVAELAAVARAHGARTALDAAQLAPHRRISIRELDVDYVALSGHKLYAPFGAGALIGRADWLRAAAPHLAGGGASQAVRGDRGQLAVVWNDGPERHEAGSPNTIGAYALAVACEELRGHADAIAEHERRLLARLRRGLAAVPGIGTLRLFDHDPDGADPDGADHQTADLQAVGTVPDGADLQAVGTVSFVVDGFEPGHLAAVLSAEYGIGVRDGAFCAHIATRRLTGRTGSGSGSGSALRVSLGLGTTTEHVDRLVLALRQIVARGPRWTYVCHDGRWAPTPDPRELPPFLR